MSARRIRIKNVEEIKKFISDNRLVVMIVPDPVKCREVYNALNKLIKKDKLKTCAHMMTINRIRHVNTHYIRGPDCDHYNKVVKINHLNNSYVANCFDCNFDEKPYVKTLPFENVVEMDINNFNAANYYVREEDNSILIGPRIERYNFDFYVDDYTRRCNMLLYDLSGIKSYQMHYPAQTDISGIQMQDYVHTQIVDIQKRHHNRHRVALCLNHSAIFIPVDIIRAYVKCYDLFQFQ